MSDLLRLEDAAARLGVSRATVQSYIKSGKLKAVKVGRGIRIRESDFQEFIEGRESKEISSSC